MPFGLRNDGATYQRLVDNAFHKQIRRNLKVYVDDLVIKSHIEDEIVRDIEETFKTLREINMKLNPKKCTFGAAEGMFLRFKVNTKGLKVCPDKVDAVLSLPSPKCLKDVQKLNRKLTSLNSRRGVQANEATNSGASNVNRTNGKGGTYHLFGGSQRNKEESPDTLMEVEEELPEPWILFTDGSSCTDGSGAGLILTNPEGMEFTYALRFRFDATNNEAEYQALIAGLWIAEQMCVKNLQANVDSRLVANQVEEPDDEAASKVDWFKKPKKPLTPDPDWNKRQHVDFRPSQTWISNIARAGKPPTSFDELMDTLIDFFVFVMNQLNITNLTQELLKMNHCSTSLKIMKWYDYGHLDGIEVRREDQQLHKFKEDERYDLNVALRMFSTRIVIQRRVKDLQLGVESYQKKLSLTKPDTCRPDLRKRIAFTAYSNPQGVIYMDQNNRNRLMRTDELHKFSDGTLNHVWTTLHDITLGIRLEYLPKKKWSRLDKRRANVMIQDIDKQLRVRRLMRSLEKFIGGREYGEDLMEDDEEESDIDDEIRDEELHDKMKSEMEGDECLQNIHDQKVASKVKKTCPLSNSKEDREGSICSGHFKKAKVPQSGDSMLQLMDDLVKALPKTLKKIGLRSYVLTTSSSVGYSGGILCVWDPRMFHKINSTVFDYFVMIKGEWVPNGKKLLMILVYAPQELTEKKMLWDYLTLVIDKWNDEVVIMGDFNEVRKQTERYGVTPPNWVTVE
ncbi:reverse transcriptase domain-containing protein, partial [Tanacetum coccineum]